MLYKELHNSHVMSDHVTDKLVHTIKKEVCSVKLFAEPFFVINNYDKLPFLPYVGSFQRVLV